MPTIHFTDSTPGTLIYAFPVTASLATWDTNRIQLVEATSPNTGRWVGTLTSGEWRIFEGNTQPTDFTQAIASVIVEESASGSGARTVTITILLEGNPVEGAKVRLTKSGESYLLTTDELGEATFNLDDGTWTVSITSPGTSFTGASLVVNGNESEAYSLTPINIPTPSSPDRCSVYALVVDKDIQPEQDVTVTAYLHAVTGTGTIYTKEIITETSDSDGVVVFELGRNLYYRFRRESGKLTEPILIPDEAEYQLPSIL